ncbi:oxygenase [Nocardia sp. SYP-A9097]|uniref:FAD-dependent oxidoreductase n=1 Tax=Nocardia sp. SYP-A9097 TaxID=2663237 RepID=UPI00129C03F1|nr:FAD-dependent monooxygenase [Nocardia sp. SYP-A9097]MRH92357.1 oxygenase [Nocardia sp. SYP-A9097]
MTHQAHTQVVIVGAGPVGLMLACELARRDVPHLVVERRSQLSTQPKALALWNGAIEAMLRAGVDRREFGEGIALRGGSYWSRGRQIATIDFAGLRETGTLGPIVLPQPEVERILLNRYRDLGGEVHWDSSVTHIDATGDTATVSTTCAAGELDISCRWVVGADGSRSTVRTHAGIAFDGDSYPEDFVLADAVLAEPGLDAEVQYHLGPQGTLVVVPLPHGMHRVFLCRPDQPDRDSETPRIETINETLAHWGLDRFRIAEAEWTSQFRVHRRVAADYIRGRAVLVGDAAHVHSPAGGQGLNTGIQDAANLGWKLALALAGGDEKFLLDSYRTERRPIAEQVAKLTDLQVRAWMMRAPVAIGARDLLLRAASRTGLLGRRIVPSLAQLDLDYSRSAMSRAAPGSHDAGRPIPDALLADGATTVRLRDLLDDPRPLLLLRSGMTDPDTPHFMPYLQRSFDRSVNIRLLAPAYARPEPGVLRDTDGLIDQWLGTHNAALLRPDGFVLATGRLRHPQRPDQSALVQVLNRTVGRSIPAPQHQN